MLAARTTPQEKWQRPLLFAAMLVFAMVSGACGSTTTIGSPSCKSTNLCFGVNMWTKGNTTFTPGVPQGTMSKVFLRLLYCDSTCQGENGFTADYTLLGDATLQNWFQIGYRADGANNGGMYFYSGSQYGGKTIWMNYESVDIPTQVGAYINFGVNHVLDPSNTYSTNYMQLIYADPYGGWSTSSFAINTTSFAPNSIEIGEAIHGTQGESADTSVWLSNRYETSAKLLYPVASNYPTLLGDFLAKTNYGSILQNQPPYAFWLGANIFNDGDGFAAYCCKP